MQKILISLISDLLVAKNIKFKDECDDRLEIITILYNIISRKNGYILFFKLHVNV